MRLPLPALLVALGLASVSAPAFAQPAPIPVHEDPMHRIVFENEFVRVIDVRIPPGQTSLYHRHVIPSVIVYLTKSTNRSESWPEKEILTRDISPGQSRYAAYDEKPLAHRVTNTGDGQFHVFDIELLRKKPAEKTPPPPPLTPAAKTHWDEALLRSSALAIERGTTVRLPAARRALLLVGIRGAVRITGGAAPVPLNAEGYVFLAPGAALELTANGEAAAELVLLELN